MMTTIMMMMILNIMMMLQPMMLVTKKGSQQMMKTPITVPKVFAAFVSFEILLLKMIVIMITNMMIMKW